MEHRSKQDIFAAILTAAGSGRRMTLTDIVSNCYIHHPIATRYTGTLVQNGLLEFDDLDRIFTTTDKGFKFLKLHNEMNQILSVEGNSLTF